MTNSKRAAKPKQVIPHGELHPFFASTCQVAGGDSHSDVMSTAPETMTAVYKRTQDAVSRGDDDALRRGVSVLVQANGKSSSRNGVWHSAIRPVNEANFRTFLGTIDGAVENPNGYSHDGCLVYNTFNFSTWHKTSPAQISRAITLICDFILQELKANRKNNLLDVVTAAGKPRLRGAKPLAQAQSPARVILDSKLGVVYEEYVKADDNSDADSPTTGKRSRDDESEEDEQFHAVQDPQPRVVKPRTAGRKDASAPDCVIATVEKAPAKIVTVDETPGSPMSFLLLSGYDLDDSFSVNGMLAPYDGCFEPCITLEMIQSEHVDYAEFQGMEQLEAGVAF